MSCGKGKKKLFDFFFYRETSPTNSLKSLHGFPTTSVMNRKHAFSLSPSTIHIIITHRFRVIILHTIFHVFLVFILFLDVLDLQPTPGFVQPICKVPAQLPEIQRYVGEGDARCIGSICRYFLKYRFGLTMFYKFDTSNEFSFCLAYAAVTILVLEAWKVISLRLTNGDINILFFINI